MCAMQPVTITRRVDFAFSPDELWQLVSTPDSLSAWLGDSVELDLRPAGSGVVIDGGVIRDVRVTEVSNGRRLGFVWCDRDDPSTPSHVTFDVESDRDGGSHLVITETLTASGGAADAADIAGAQAAWEVRVLSLWACTVVAALVQ